LIIKKNDLKNISKMMLFLGIILLPFINITNIIGMETFLDSFENSESYIFLKNNDHMSATDTFDQSYIIIQRDDHPDFKVDVNDEIIFSTYRGDIVCDKINDIKEISGYKIFHTATNEFNEESNVVYDNQIIGKVIKIVDENILNTISLKTWGITIDSLNINSIID